MVSDCENELCAKKKISREFVEKYANQLWRPEGYDWDDLLVILSDLIEELGHNIPTGDLDGLLPLAREDR